MDKNIFNSDSISDDWDSNAKPESIKSEEPKDTQESDAASSGGSAGCYACKSTCSGLCEDTCKGVSFN